MLALVVDNSRIISQLVRSLPEELDVKVQTSDSDATSEHALITASISRCFAKYDIPKLGDQFALFVEMQRGRSLAGRKLL